MRIEFTSTERAEGFWQALDSVARERKYLIFTAGPDKPKSAQFVADIIEKSWSQFLAIRETDEVVGWCDVIRYETEGFRHCGRLGMSVVREYRGRGLGRRLLQTTLDDAFAKGLERIELEVYASNLPAIGLYEKFGFQVEGRKEKARYIDGEYDDSILMVLWRPQHFQRERDLCG